MFYWINNRTGYQLRIDILLICGFLILTLSCTPGKRTDAKLYSMDSLVSKQARYLIHHHATLNKITQLGPQNEKVSLKPNDTVAWKKELEIFQVLDVINKPVNKDLYKIEQYADSRSNLRVRSFTTSEKLAVKFVKIYFQRIPQRIRKVEASYQESNALYHSVRLLSMEFEQLRDTAVLTSYSITGGQRMFLDDSVRYYIKGTVKLEND